MFEQVSNNLWPQQASRQKRFAASACADIHCHCLPGVDDGPANMSEALRLCTALAEDGVTHVVATPHQLGRYDGSNGPDAIRHAVSELNLALGAERIPLIVLPGADVRVDERIPELLASDGILSVADQKRYVLLELPHDTFVDIGVLVQLISAGGCSGILTHPERHTQLASRPQLAWAWAEHGLLVQVTAGSLLGDFGPAAESAAWDWLQKGLVDLIASDAHDAVRRRPRLTQAIDAISSRLTHVIARRLCIDNPLRVLRGEPVPDAGRRTINRRREVGVGS